MNTNKLSFSKQVSIFTTALVITSITPALAQNRQPIDISNTGNSNTVDVRFVQPVLEREPENRGAPGDRKGAGSRGNCPAVVNKPELVGLVPLVQTKGNSVVLGLTTSEHPTFWFYVPYAPKNISSAKFVLLDEKNNLAIKEPLPITLAGTPGVIGISIPKTEKALEIGKYYHWYFVMNCQPKTNVDDLAVEGLVQRVALKPELQSRLQTATPKQSVAIYAQSGMWQDAITLLAELRLQQPGDATLATDWQDLLKSIQLDNIANQPIKSKV